MGLVQILPLTEAATFTAGCAVLRSVRIDPERVAIVLIIGVAVLAAALLIALTPPDIGGDSLSLDPTILWPRLP